MLDNLKAEIQKEEDLFIALMRTSAFSHQSDNIMRKEWRKIMKKRYVVILTIFICLMPLFTTLAKNEQVVFGGDNMENATTVGCGISYLTQYAGEITVYFKFIPDNSERFNITYLCTFFPSSGGCPEFTILDENGKELASKAIDLGKYHQNKRYDYKNTATTVTLEKNQTYYIKLYLGTRETLLNFSICSQNLHSQNEKFTTTKQPSCSETGEQVSYCEFCGGISETQEIPALGHKPGDWRIETKATCALEGTKVRRCTICNIAVETETIPLLEHTPAPEKITTLPATCETAGQNTTYCTACGQIAATEVILPTGHIAGEWAVDKAPACETPGLYAQRCTICNILIDSQSLDAQGHVPGEPIITTAATCLQKGVEKIICQVCNQTLESAELPLADHVAGEMETIWYPTCESGGIREQHCTTCNKLLATEEIPAYPHMFGETIVLQEAGCENTGHVENCCVACKAVLSVVEIPALGHSATSMLTLREAGCTYEGKRLSVCIDCGKTLYEETLQSLGHAASEWKETAPSCLSSGIRIRECIICNAILAQEEITALGHSFTDWNIITEASKEQEGERQRHCIHCGESQFEKIEKLPKVFGIF